VVFADNDGGSYLRETTSSEVSVKSTRKRAIFNKGHTRRWPGVLAGCIIFAYEVETHKQNVTSVLPL
jgi:hypothetical protein